MCISVCVLWSCICPESSYIIFTSLKLKFHFVYPVPPFPRPSFPFSLHPSLPPSLLLPFLPTPGPAPIEVDQIKVVPHPTPIRFPFKTRRRIVAVSCGSRHTLALDDQVGEEGGRKDSDLASTALHSELNPSSSLPPSPPSYFLPVGSSLFLGMGPLRSTGSGRFPSLPALPPHHPLPRSLLLLAFLVYPMPRGSIDLGGGGALCCCGPKRPGLHLGRGELRPIRTRGRG